LVKGLPAQGDELGQRAAGLKISDLAGVKHAAELTAFGADPQHLELPLDVGRDGRLDDPDPAKRRTAGSEAAVEPGEAGPLGFDQRQRGLPVTRQERLPAGKA
jgi:hypothetical protein